MKIKLCSFENTLTNGAKFTSQVAYLINDDGTDIKKDGKAVHFRFKLVKKAKEKNPSIPCTITVQDTDFKITDDKDRNENVRLDQNGKPRKILFIYDFQEEVHKKYDNGLKAFLNNL